MDRLAALRELLGAASAFDDVDITRLGLVGEVVGAAVRVGARTVEIDGSLPVALLRTAPYYSRLVWATEAPRADRAEVVDDAVASGVVAMLSVSEEYARLWGRVVDLEATETYDHDPIGGMPYRLLLIRGGYVNELSARLVAGSGPSCPLRAVAEELAAAEGWSAERLLRLLISDIPHLIRSGAVALDETVESTLPAV